jgi:Spy/CpxP family protein refolding chaperone
MPPIAAASIGLGAIQGLVGLAGLINMSRTPMPNYSISPELRAAKSRSSEMAQMGFTPEQKAEFRTNQADILAANNQNITDMSGGQLSRALNNRGTMSLLRGGNEFAKADAERNRQNILDDYSMTNRIQQQMNMATQQEIMNRRELERAYGGAMQSGLNNIVSSANLNQMVGLYGNQKNTTNPMNNVFQINPSMTSPTGTFGIDKPLYNPLFG